MWIELPNLLYHFYQWSDKIANWLWKVLGSWKRTFINPSWHPQVLVEIDMAKPLLEEIYINCGKFNFTQKILYKHLSNACFHCGRKGHAIKHYPLKVSTKPIPLLEEADPIKIVGKTCNFVLTLTFDERNQVIVASTLEKKIGENKKEKDFIPQP